MQPTILRSQVLKAIDTGEQFDLVFITADRKRGTGGDLISCKGWQKQVKASPQGTTGFVKKIKPKVATPGKTIVIHNPISKNIHPITVHIRLMQFFNNERILNG